MSRADELYAKHSKSQRALREIENERAQREAEESARIAREATEQQRIATEKAEREKNRKLPSASQMQTTPSLDMADSALQIEQRKRENRVAEIMKQSQDKAKEQQIKKDVVESHNNNWEPEVKVDKPVTKEEAQAQYQKEYEREQNRIQAEKQIRDYEEIGREHPVLGTALSGATNLASVVGAAEIGRAAISSDNADPNSPYFAPQRITQALRSAAKENIDSKAGQVAYDIGTTVGDMVLMKFTTGPLGSLGYAGAMAAQAASSTAQDGVERGLSDSQIVAESIASAALTAVCEKIGFDKVFKPASATTAKGIIRNVVTGFAAEGSEEAVEEATNILFDYVIAQDQSNYNLSVEDYINQGYSEDEAKIKALGQMASQVGQSFLMGGAAGGIISGFNSTVNYADNRFSGRDIDTLVSSDVNTPQNAQNSVQNSSVETQTEQFADQTQSAVQSENNELVNELDDMETDTEIDDTDFDTEEYYDSQMYSEDIQRQAAEKDGFEFENEDARDWQEVENFLNSLNSEKAQNVVRTMQENRAVAADPNATYEQRSEAQSKVIKAEYDAAAYEGITGEKTEYPVITGNPGVDAAVNPRGVIRTVDAQAENNIITLAQKKFGKTVRFVDTLNGANGYMNKKTGEIVIARDANGKLTTVFGHEYTHFLEGTKEYIDLLRHIKNNSATVKNRIAQSGVGDWNGLVKQTQAEYAVAGITLSDADAEMEIVAQTIGEEFFSDENALTSLATQNRSLFQRFKQWFERNLYKTVRGGIHKEMSAEKAAKQTYRLLLRAQQATTKNTATQGDGVKYNLNAYSEKQRQNWAGSKRIVLYENDVQLQNFIETAKKNGSFDKKIYFGAVSTELAEAIRNETGVDVENYNLSLNADEIRKIFRKHGNEKAENLQGQRAVTNEDFTNIPLVIQSPDSISLSSKNYNGKPVIVFTKDINGKNTVVTVVSDRNKDLFVQTAYFGIKKGSLAPPLDAQAPNITSETPRGTASDNSISKSPENVKRSVKKSDIVADLVSTYNYTQETANKVFVNAYNLKKKMGSKANIQEVSAVIANALEKRRAGNFGESDITAVVDLIASGSKTENETVISKAKPILNYLKGIKITLSDTDISDLGESFSNARGKLFPYLTLAKQGGISVDSLYQDLSARFPESFNAAEVTHPADQVNSIIGFLDYYRTHRYVGAFEDSEAYEALQNDIRTMFSTASDAKSFVGQLNALCDKYGELKNGVPKSTDGATKVRRTAASIYGGESVQNNLALAEKFGEKIVQGHFNYEVQLQGKQAEAYVESIKNAPDVVKAFEEEYRNCRNAIVGLGANPTADEVLKASALLPMAAEYLNERDFIEYATSLAEVGTQAGRAVSALRYVSKFSGAQQLIAVQRKVDDYNRKIEDKFLKGQGKFGENGQVEETEYTSGNKGVDIAVKTRKNKTFTPVEIDKSLQEELVKARGAEEIERIMRKVTDDIASQIDYSWWDKLNAFRYFAMLSNPRTWIRNSVGNAVMIGSSRVKDVVGVGIDKISGGKGYDTDNPQTRAVIISKDAKAAAQNLITQDNTIERLFSGQEKYTGKSGIQNMQRQNALSSTPVLRNLVKIQEKGIDDQPFRIFRAKSVLAQAIEANLKNGNIENLEDFQTVALNGNDEHLSNDTRLKYRRMYDRFCEIAAREADEATFREENKLINKINKFKQGNTTWEKGVAVLSEGAMPFLKTPANIVKRGAEYSPLGLGKTLVADSVKLHNDTIDTNQYVNNLAKGLTGSAVWGLGMALGAIGALSAGDDEEEDTAKRKLENGQEYAVNIGDYSFTIDWLTPASLSLFMGVKTSEMIQQARDGLWEWADLLGLASTALDIAQSITEPMFNLTMLDGLDGAFRAIQSGSYEGGTNAQVMALLEYCAESYISQFFPSVIASVARTTDDTVRTYYTDKGDKIPDELESFGTTITKKIPGLANQNASLLDIWGQPKSSGNLGERVAENFVSPGYLEKKNTTAEIRAMFKFAEENKIAYTDILPVKPDTEYKKPDKSTVYWTQDEYEQLASAVGQAQKDAVQKYLVEGQPVSVEYTLPMLDSSLKSGKRTLKVTYTGDIRKARNTARWAPTSSIKYDENGKPASITAASDEDFRAMLYKKLMESVVEQAQAQAIDKLLKNKE